MRFSDWIASRSVRLHAAFAALWTAALPVLAAFTAEDWAALGLSQRGVILAMALMNILHAAGGLYVRAITTAPLAGRAAKAEPGFGDGQ